MVVWSCSWTQFLKSFFESKKVTTHIYKVLENPYIYPLDVEEGCQFNSGREDFGSLSVGYNIRCPRVYIQLIASVFINHRMEVFMFPVSGNYVLFQNNRIIKTGMVNRVKRFNPITKETSLTFHYLWFLSNIDIFPHGTCTKRLGSLQTGELIKIPRLLQVQFSIVVLMLILYHAVIIPLLLIENLSSKTIMRMVFWVGEYWPK